MPSIMLQRAAVVAVASFVFFLLMLVAFYVRGQFGYFVLSTAFLAIYIFTLIGWVIRRRKIVSIFENGIQHGSFEAAWDELVSMRSDKDGLTIVKNGNVRTHIARSVAGFESILKAVKHGVEREDRP